MARTADTIWLDDSIVARRGIGWGSKPCLHDLTEATQGKYHYTIGPYSDPVLTAKPGDRIRIETRDAFEGAIRSESDKPTERLRMPFVNPHPTLTVGGHNLLKYIYFSTERQLCSANSPWAYAA